MNIVHGLRSNKKKKEEEEEEKEEGDEKKKKKKEEEEEKKKKIAEKLWATKEDLLQTITSINTIRLDV